MFDMVLNGGLGTYAASSLEAATKRHWMTDTEIELHPDAPVAVLAHVAVLPQLLPGFGLCWRWLENARGRPASFGCQSEFWRARAQVIPCSSVAEARASGST
jgi:hypothetical protein